MSGVLVMSEDVQSALSVSLRLTGSAWVTCHAYKDGGPILTVHDGAVSVSIAPSMRCDVTPGDVAAARSLARAVARYATECEKHCPDAALLDPAAA